MTRFRIRDLVHTIESEPTDPSLLRSKFGDMIVNSTVCLAKVEAFNPETGEYRVVLQGTIDKDDTDWEDLEPGVS